MISDFIIYNHKQYHYFLTLSPQLIFVSFSLILLSCLMPSTFLLPFESMLFSLLMSSSLTSPTLSDIFLLWCFTNELYFFSVDWSFFSIYCIVVSFSFIFSFRIWLLERSCSICSSVMHYPTMLITVLFPLALRVRSVLIMGELYPHFTMSLKHRRCVPSFSLSEKRCAEGMREWRES